MSSVLGHKLKVSVFGQSHSAAIGAVIDGLPAGEEIDLSLLSQFMARRAPGNSALQTARKEADCPEILSGVLPKAVFGEAAKGRTEADQDGNHDVNTEGNTEANAEINAKAASLTERRIQKEKKIVVCCGAPLCAVIHNTDTRSRDYDKLREIPRPGHADYTAWVKYRGFQDVRGGGHFSGRLTAPLCFAGGIALQILKRRGIFVGAHIGAIRGIKDTPYDPVAVTGDELCLAGQKTFPVNDDEKGSLMQKEILFAKEAGDSVGGIIECAVIGMPKGVGEPMFDGVENRLAAALFGIPAVKGVEFGEGFGAAELLGSEHNDAYRIEGDTVLTKTNHAGGILGGITNGMPIVFRIAVKPTPSILKEQASVALSERQECKLKIEGRHDPCIVPRAVPVVEAVTALVLLDMLLEDKKD